MTRCEELQNKIDDCTSKAINTSDKNLKAFYSNAAKGFQMKLENLTVEECSEVVE